jgi:hypothetical protein
LAKLRASVVNTTSLAAVGADLGIGAALRLGKGEEMSGVGARSRSWPTPSRPSSVRCTSTPAGSGRRRSSSISSARPSTASSDRPGATTTRPGCRSSRPSSRWVAQLPHRRQRTGSRQALPGDGRSSTASPAARGRARPRSEQNRRPPGPPGTASPRRTPRGSRMAMLELPEVETIRRDLERELAGRKVKTVECKGPQVPAPSPQEERHRPPRGSQGRVRPTPGHAARGPVRQRARDGHRPRDPRPAPAGCLQGRRRRRHRGHDHLHPGRRSPVLRHRRLGRALRRRSRDPRRDPRRARTDRPRPARGADHLGRLRPARHRQGDAAETAAHRSRRSSTASATSTATRSSSTPGCATTG